MCKLYTNVHKSSRAYNFYEVAKNLGECDHVRNTLLYTDDMSASGTDNVSWASHATWMEIGNKIPCTNLPPENRVIFRHLRQVLAFSSEEVTFNEEDIRASM